jgi:hypothetical protein
MSQCTPVQQNKNLKIPILIKKKKKWSLKGNDPSRWNLDNPLFVTSKAQKIRNYRQKSKAEIEESEFEGSKSHNFMWNPNYIMKFTH